MKKRLLLLLATMLTIPLRIVAQDIQVLRFDRNYTSLIASMNQVKDNAGEVCAVIRFWVRDKDFEVEPNLGYLKRETKSGEIRLWVPRGTKRLTVRHKGMKPLVGYEIPVQIESKVTYDVEIETTGYNPYSSNSEKIVYVGAGFNVMSIMGPSLSLGFDLGVHNIELSAVYGLHKTDDWYFYESDGNVTEAYNYQAIRVQLRYGYEIEATDFLSLIPQVGAGYNIMSGKNVSGISNSKTTHKSAGSFSALAGVRLVASLGETFKLHITPEYDFGVYKNDTNKLIEKNDNKFKSWTNGFNLNVGLMVFF